MTTLAEKLQDAKDEIAQLKSELDRWKLVAHERDALRRDAERWKWVSHKLYATAHGYDTMLRLDEGADGYCWINGVATYDLNAAIDAAMKGKHHAD